MFIINFSFFLILLKIFFLVLLNLNNYIAYKLKNYFIYYFIYDIIISILILIINFIYTKNFIVQNLLLNLSVIALILQSYSFLYIIYLIIKKKEILAIEYKGLFYYYVIILIFKITISFLHNYNSILHFNFLFLLNKYKIFFFSNILFHLIFQYNIKIKCFTDFYFYIKNYKIDSKLKKSYYLFFYTFLIKSIIYDYLLICFDILSFLNYHNYFFYISYTFNIYEVLYILLFLSLANYFSIFFIILTAKKEISISLDVKNNLNQHLIFSALESYKIIAYEVSFYYFLLNIVKNNMSKQLEVTDKMNAIILNNNKYYADLFNENNVIYKEIIKNKIISYDYYYNILNSYLFIKNNLIADLREEMISSIILELEKYNIRLMSAFYVNNKLSGYLVLFNKSFIVKKILTNSDISILYNLSNYITFSYQKLTKNIFYNQLNYQKKISECNLIENNYKYVESFEKLNEKIKDIKQIFLYENKKKIFKIFSTIDIPEVINYISNIHKSEQSINSNELNSKYIFIDIDNTSYSILSSGKILLDTRHYASFYTILPFVRKEYGLLYNFYYNDRIDTIFSYNDKYLDNDKIFFSCFDNNFNVKLIIFDVVSNSFFKMIQYFAISVGFDCIYISFKNINDNNFNKIFDYYNYMLEENKQYYIFFRDIEKESKVYQKCILDRYMNYVLNVKNIFIKLFFIIISENEIKNIHQEIIQLAKNISIKINNQKEINPHFLAIIINNYSNKILNKQFSLKVINEFIAKHLHQRFNNIYDFIDLFEQNIIIESYQNKFTDDTLYIKEAIKLKKESLKNHILMQELLKIYKNNYTKIASVIEVHKSTISRYFKNMKNKNL